MVSLRRALLVGFLTWLMAFVTSVVIFPIHRSSRPLGDVGLTYLIIPTITVTIGAARAAAAPRPEAGHGDRW